MRVTLYALVMGFGALVAGIGLVLLFRKHEQQSQSRIKIFNQELQFSAPGLVVALAGCVLFVLLPVLGVGDRELFPVEPHDGIHGDITTGHHSFETAYLIKLGSSTKGTITTPTDRDFFKFQVPTTLTGVPKIRIIAEKIFWAKVTVYDKDEQNVNYADSMGGDPVSLSFDGTAGANYYIAVESMGGGRGEYTLIVKPE